jgi:transcriptional regulator GlxA family with amidase domain
MCYPGLVETLLAATAPAPLRSADHLLLRRIRDQLDRDLGRALDVEQLAHSIGLAPRTLTRRFQIAYGRSPYDYLVARRTDPRRTPYTAVSTGREG